MSNRDFAEYNNRRFRNLKAYVPKTYTEPGCMGGSCTLRETSPGPNKRSRTPQLHESSRNGFRNINGYPKEGYYTESELNTIQRNEAGYRLAKYRRGSVHRVAQAPRVTTPRAFGSLVEGANNEAARRAAANARVQASAERGRTAGPYRPTGAANAIAAAVLNNPETRPPQSYTRVRSNPKSDTRKRKQKRRKTRRRNN
jgi:hypothetical protein